VIEDLTIKRGDEPAACGGHGLAAQFRQIENGEPTEAHAELPPRFNPFPRIVGTAMGERPCHASNARAQLAAGHGRRQQESGKATHV